ncbi:MAG: hypothetical protein AB1405_06015 [Bdellovibrionota bacterium]
MKFASKRKGLLCAMAVLASSVGFVRCESGLFSFLGVGSAALALLAGSANDIRASADLTCANLTGCDGDFNDGVSDPDLQAFAAALRCVGASEDDTIAGTISCDTANTDDATWFKSAAAVLAEAEGGSVIDELPDIEDGATEFVVFQYRTPPSSTKGCNTGAIAQAQDTYMEIEQVDVDDYAMVELIREVGQLQPSSTCVITGDWYNEGGGDETITISAGSITYDRNEQTGAQSITGNLTIAFNNGSGFGFWGSINTNAVTLTINASCSGTCTVASGSGACFSGAGASPICVPPSMLLPIGAFDLPPPP